jgi:large subunit ribosomal protein L29
MPNKAVEFNKSLQSESTEDLEARIQEDELRLKKMRFAHAVTPLESPVSIRHFRRDIARMKTELRKRELSK